ncbi:MAG: hypothetical protein ACPHK8_03840 [Thermoplasmatota archaeon]
MSLLAKRLQLVGSNSTFLTTKEIQLLLEACSQFKIDWTTGIETTCSHPVAASCEHGEPFLVYRRHDKSLIPRLEDVKVRTKTVGTERDLKVPDIDVTRALVLKGVILGRLREDA